MKKISTLFKKDPDNLSRVTREVDSKPILELNAFETPKTKNRKAMKKLTRIGFIHKWLGKPMKKIIGYSILVILGIGFFTLLSLMVGFITTLLAFIFTLLLIGLVLLAMSLINND